MARTLELVVPPDRTDPLIARLQQADGILGLRLYPEASLAPNGNVIVIQATNDAAASIMREVKNDGVIIVETKEPMSFVGPDVGDRLDRESNEALWEEMASFFRSESNPSFNYLALMLLSGAIAAVGLWSDTLHLVIGAMVIAPGFHPILRLPFGRIAGPPSIATNGAKAVLYGYGFLALGGAITYALLAALEAERSTELTTRGLVAYWSTFSGPGLLVSVFAALAGAFTAAAGRAVLAAGAMIALALIPSMTIAGMAFAALDGTLVARGAGRWAFDVAVVALAGVVVFTLKRRLVHRRRGLG